MSATPPAQWAGVSTWAAHCEETQWQQALAWTVATRACAAAWSAANARRAARSLERGGIRQAAVVQVTVAVRSACPVRRTVHGLTDAPRAVPLPSPTPHGDHFAHREGAAREVSQPGYEAALLQAACDRQGVTLFSGLLTGFLVLLCGYGDQRDLVVATPTAGRREAGSHRLIGCFVNTMLLRLDLRDNPSLAQLTLRCQDTVREALGREHRRSRMW
ncbi:condensation domain-containing protein [Streptomyces sp. NPDC054813]